MSPGRPALPNAGVEVEPNAGAPNAGAGVEVAGFENAEDPNAGAAVEVAGFEKAEDPKAGALLVAGVENADVPNAGALLAGVDVDDEGVPHTDVRWPKPDGAPNAPLPAPKEGAGRAPKVLELDGAAKAEVEGAPKAGAGVCAGAGDACGWEVPSATTRPG